MQTVTSATVDPTERSIPPAIMMMVMPSAAVPTITDCTAIDPPVFEREEPALLAGQCRKQQRDQDQSQKRAEDTSTPSRACCAARSGKLQVVFG